MSAPVTTLDRRVTPALSNREMPTSPPVILMSVASMLPMSSVRMPLVLSTNRERSTVAVPLLTRRPAVLRRKSLSVIVAHASSTQTPTTLSANVVRATVRLQRNQACVMPMSLPVNVDRLMVVVLGKRPVVALTGRVDADAHVPERHPVDLERALPRRGPPGSCTCRRPAPSRSGCR